MIREVLTHYFPQWEPPDDYTEWNPCQCPVHDDDNPSAAVSYEHDAFVCHGCGYKGDVIKIIRREEECDYPTAIGVAQRIAEDSGIEVPRLPTRKRSRRVPRPARFGKSTWN